MKQSWKEIRPLLILFILWRVGIFFVGYFASQVLPFKRSFPYINEQLIPSGFPEWIWSWGNFDGVHYLDISKNGYHAAGLPAFFPLYPLLIKFFGEIFGNHLFAALLISNTFALLSFISIYFLVKKHFDKNIAKIAVSFLMLYPMSFYMGAIYTESLFIFLVICSFFTSGIKSIILGAFASFTRLVGVGLSLALLIERKKLIFLSASFGLLVFMAYLKYQFDDPLKFLSGQSVFGNARSTSLATLVLPPQVIFRYLKIFITANPSHYDFWVAIWEMTFFVFSSVVLTILTWKRTVPSSWLIYSWISLLVPSFSGTLSSMPRYSITIFPIFVGLALIKSKPIRYTILTLFTILLALFTALFTRGYWVS